MTSLTRLPVAITIVVVAFVGAAFSSTRAASVFDITFPIPELGSCADRAACKEYCNDAANQSACQSFAEAHGLTVRTQSNSETESQSNTAGDDKLQAIQKDGGPGKCATGASDPEKTCRAYCNATAHIPECVAYGKSHGFLKGDQLAQAEKVAAALKSGVALPQGCTDQQSCEETCHNPTSLDQARSCFAFAKAADLLPPGFDGSKAERVFSAIQEGSAPFSSMKDFQQCERARDPSVIKKCTDFAVQSGMMTQEEADVVKETGGKGPGGCQGKDECEQYCADHGDECFEFSREHDLVRPEQQQHMQAAANQLKQALDHMPAGAKDCIVAAVGQDVLDGLLAGTKPGTQKIGTMMRQCFDQVERSGEQGNERDQFGPPPQDDQYIRGDAGSFNDQNRGSEVGPGNRMMPPRDPRDRFMQPPRGPDQSMPADQTDRQGEDQQWQGNDEQHMMPNSGDPETTQRGQWNGPRPMPPQGAGVRGQRMMPPGNRMNGGNGGNWMPPPLQSDAQQIRPGDNGAPRYIPGNYNGLRPEGMMPDQNGSGPQNMGPNGGPMPGNPEGGTQTFYPNVMPGGEHNDGLQLDLDPRPADPGIMSTPPSDGVAPPSGDQGGTPQPQPQPTAPTSFIGTIQQLASATFSFFSSH